MNEPDALDGAGNHSVMKTNAKNVHMYMRLSSPKQTRLRSRCPVSRQSQ